MSSENNRSWPELSGLSSIGFSRAEINGTPQYSANPRSGENNLGVYYYCADADVQKALTLAEKAFAVLRDSPIALRAHLLRGIAANLQKKEAEFVVVTCAETGLPEARIKGELARTCTQLRLFADVIEEGSCFDARLDSAEPTRTPPKPDLRSVRLALGPVVVFCASNFPLAFSVAGGDTASALAAGCPVIVKSHSLHPFTAELAAQEIAAAVKQLDLPEGTFSLLHGSGTSLGKTLVEDKRVSAVGFTGSEAGGRALLAYSSNRENPIPVFAEMGSVNPVFLLENALSEKAQIIAEAMHASLTNGVGQFCTCPGLIIAKPSTALEIFIESLANALAKTDKQPMLSKAGATKFTEAVQQMAAQNEVAVVTEGETDKAWARPRLLKVDAKTFIRNPNLQHEMFGPAALIICVENDTERLAVANVLKGQLTATLWANEADAGVANSLLHILQSKVGRILFNGVPTGVEVSHSMVHGGPFPASSDARFTSVGSAAIFRFLRPVCFQNTPNALLPALLKNENPCAVPRFVNGQWVLPTRAK